MRGCRHLWSDEECVEEDEQLIDEGGECEHGRAGWCGLACALCCSCCGLCCRLRHSSLAPLHLMHIHDANEHVHDRRREQRVWREGEGEARSADGRAMEGRWWRSTLAGRRRDATEGSSE